MLSFRGVTRLVMLTSMVLLFLAEVGRMKRLANAAKAAAAALAYQPKDLRYRLLRGAWNLLRKTPKWMIRKWARTLLADGI